MRAAGKIRHQLWKKHIKMRRNHGTTDKQKQQKILCNLIGQWRNFVISSEMKPIFVLCEDPARTCVNFLMEFPYVRVQWWSIHINHLKLKLALGLTLHTYEWNHFSAPGEQVMEGPINVNAAACGSFIPSTPNRQAACTPRVSTCSYCTCRKTCGCRGGHCSLGSDDDEPAAMTQLSWPRADEWTGGGPHSRARSGRSRTIWSPWVRVGTGCRN